MSLFYALHDIPEFNNLKNTDISNSNKLNKIDSITKSNEKYKIIRYDKNILSIDLISIYGLLRSVVINNMNKVVSFSPPKSIPYSHFTEIYPEFDVIAEEFVEGTMINVFWDPSSGLSGCWEIATRNTVGADISFYRSGDNTKTFRTMFMETILENNLELNDLDKKNNYSFVLQHPLNRIVKPFIKAQLYLVEVYEIVNLENGYVNVFPINLNIIKQNEVFKNSTIKFPQIYDMNTYNEIKLLYASMNTSYDIMGVILRHMHTNNRCKIRNPVYEQIKHLRGNQSKLQYQYLCLRQTGKIEEYLTFYPEHKKQFSAFRDNLHLFTETLYQNYISCYIMKEKQLINYPAHFRTHMFNLHKIYINELKLKQEYINKSEVIKFVNNLHPSLQMYSLNTHIKKQKVDIQRYA